MNNLEYKLMNKAHFNYGNIIFAMAGSVRGIEQEIAKGDIPAVSRDFRDVAKGYAVLESNYRRIDVLRYDKEHGGLIMKEIKERGLPELHQIIEEFKRVLKHSSREDLQKKLQHLRKCICVFRSLGNQFGKLPKYQQYREERKRRSGANCT